MNIETWCNLYGLECLKYEPIKEGIYIVYDRTTGKEYHVPAYIVEKGRGPEEKEEKEQVNHPSHYNLPGKKECIDEMVDIYGASAQR